MRKLTTALAAAWVPSRRDLAALACALLLGSPVTWAQQTDDAKRIRDELALLQQEQQAVFQQFQMVRELRNGLMAPAPSQPPLTYQSIPNYDDVVAAQRAQEQKVTEYGQEMDRLFARYQELEGRRQTLVEELGRATGSR